MAVRKTSVITGDIINSRRSAPSSWLNALKKELRGWGETPRQYALYRGDSFQLEVKDPADALKAAIKIKAALRSLPGVDARLAIGIGTKTRSAGKITESNGSAFVFSGGLLEELDTLKMNMAIRTGNEQLDYEMNLFLKLALVIMDGWTVNAARSVHAALRYPGRSQAALGKMLKIKQNAVSTRLKRAHFEEISELLELYRQKIKGLK